MINDRHNYWCYLKGYDDAESQDYNLIQSISLTSDIHGKIIQIYNSPNNVYNTVLNSAWFVNCFRHDGAHVVGWHWQWDYHM